MAVLRPEDFGAVGDRKADDTAALQAMFAVPSTTQLPLRYELRGRYKVTDTIKIASAPASTVYVDGEGGWIWWAGDDKPCLQLGDSVAGSKLFWSRVSGLKLGMLSADPGGVQLLIDDADFLVLDSVVIAAPGRDVGVRSYRGNSLDFRSVHVSASRDVAADITANVFRWDAGKIQQAVTGLRYSGTQFSIQSLDLSFLTQTGIQLVSAACGTLNFYSEKIGPKTSMNDAAILRANNSNAVSVNGAIFNGTWGAQSQDTHCGFGVVFTDCHRFDFIATRFQRLQRAALTTDPLSHSINVRRSCEWRFPQAGSVPMLGGGLTWEGL